MGIQTGNNRRATFMFSTLLVMTAALFISEQGWRNVKWVALATMLWLVVYLYVLNARTGLFSLYLLMMAYGVLKLFQQKRRTSVCVFTLGTAAVPLSTWQLLPTFQNRIRYFQYNYSFINKGAYLPGGNRMLSYRAGGHLLKTLSLRCYMAAALAGFYTTSGWKYNTVCFFTRFCCYGGNGFTILK